MSTYGLYAKFASNLVVGDDTFYANQDITNEV